MRSEPRQGGNLSRVQQFAASRLVDRSTRGKSPEEVAQMIVAALDNVPDAHRRDVLRNTCREIRKDIKKRLKRETADVVREAYNGSPAWAQLRERLEISETFIDELVTEFVHA